MKNKKMFIGKKLWVLFKLKASLLRSKRGLSLTEILVSLGIAGIIGGIGVAQYNAYIAPQDRRAFRNTGILFATGTVNCLSAVSSWANKYYIAGDTAQEPTGMRFPCHGSNDATCPKTANADKSLAKCNVEKVWGCCGNKTADCGSSNEKPATNNKCGKLHKVNFICPAKTKCTVVTGPEVYDATYPKTDPKHPKESKVKNYCLSLEKEISGDKHQVIVNVNVTTGEYGIYCKNHGSGSYETLNATKCQDVSKSGVTYDDWNSGNVTEQCDWPTESKTGGG